MKPGGEGPGNQGEPREDDINLHRDKAKAIIRRCLENAAQLDQAKRTKYRAAAVAVLDAMGPVALMRWNENVKSITFYPDTESINRFVQSLGHKFARATGVRGLCIRDLNQPWLCSLHLNGGVDTGDVFSWNASEAYAHEFAHAIAWKRDEAGPLFVTKGWQDAWAQNGDRICGQMKMLNRGPREGFADFGVLVWNRYQDASSCGPSCLQFWEERGLALDSAASDF
jgi:hypothetical protein